ncbi:hypothetical protein H5410_000561 [Solanum commersonii]|uniref:Uncharacterized protein n=1 Tax=Solanum commersonii TaxID=4109 RepID=A0A9J6AWK6_SOLCO|nr:hypothetical protein H5410_000561 [Solanum commersonii]
MRTACQLIIAESPSSPSSSSTEKLWSGTVLFSDKILFTQSPELSGGQFRKKTKANAIVHTRMYFTSRTSLFLCIRIVTEFYYEDSVFYSVPTQTGFSHPKLCFVTKDSLKREMHNSKTPQTSKELGLYFHHRVSSEGRENIQEGIVPFKWFDDNLSKYRFCIPLTLEGMGPVSELIEQSNTASCVHLLKDKNSSLPLKLLFLSDNHLIFPNLKKSEIGPSKWLSSRYKTSMLVRFHRDLGINPERLQEAILNVRSEVR